MIRPNKSPLTAATFAPPPSLHPAGSPSRPGAFVPDRVAVPAEPTPAMIAAAWAVIDNQKRRAGVAEIYRAMIGAAQ